MRSILACLLLVSLILGTSPLITAYAESAAQNEFEWGASLSQWWSLDATYRDPAFQVIDHTGMNIIYTDAKDGWGLAGWSTPDYQTFTTLAPGDGAVERVVHDAHARGIRVAARFDIFEDHRTAEVIPGARIGGTPAWVDPACPAVQARSIAMLEDLLQRVPVDEVNLDHVRYPDTNEASASAPLPCTGGTLGEPASGKDRVAVITAFVEDAAAAAHRVRPGVTVSASVFGASVHGPMPSIGQEGAALAPLLDVLRPMTYPSYYGSTAERRPYETLLDETRAAADQWGGAKVRPWVQGFGPYAGQADPVCSQLRGVVDGGGHGAMVWWFPSMGTEQATWSTLSSCVPAAGSPTTTEPTDLEATFRPKAGNEWWVETYIDVNQPLQEVTATVDGGSTHTLQLKSWGAWAASFHAPAGSLVQFQATSPDGTTVTSGKYRWPDATPAGESSPAFDATFRPKAGNEWWVETHVDASETLASVEARRDGGAWHALEKKSWGTWAKSFHAPAGSLVEFRATSPDGGTVVSGKYRWPDATPATTGTEPAPAWEPAFHVKVQKRWWTEVLVTADEGVESVAAVINGGPPEPLEWTQWGSWAKGMYVPAGAEVYFIAHAPDGRTATSPTYRWP